MIGKEKEMEENKDIIVETDEIQANSPNPEPLARSVYTMKAFQSSYQPATLAWDSVGDKANYNTNGAVTSEKWVRQGIYICSSDQLGGPGFFITDYDGFYDLPTYGNMFFKAVMCRLDLKVMVPPYSNFLVVVEVYRTVFKEGDGNSSTWLGMASGEWDACNTISENNGGASGEWVGAPIESGFFHFEGRSRHIDEWRPCVYKTWSIDNRYSEKVVRTSMIPEYLMNMLERPEKYNTRMGYVDKYHTSRPEFSLYYSAYVWYGDDDDDFAVDSYSERKATRLVLWTSERTGYIMKGWLDASINMLYPAGGAYRQRRGAKLQEQWIEDVVPYKVVYHYAKKNGTYSEATQTLYYMADGTVCPQPAQDYNYETPEPITASVAADGSTVIDYYYELKKYPVQYLANGGCFSSGKDIETQEYYFGMPIDLLREKPTRTGYCFSEWDPYPKYASTGYEVVTRAVWEAHQYTVKFDGNGADSGTMEPQGFVYDQPQSLNKNKYECMHTVSFAVGERRGDNAYFKPQTVGCHFMGWSEVENGEKIYDDGATVCNLSSDNNGERTLYAVWKSASIHLPQFYHEGYYFDAWYTDESFTDESRVGEPGDEYIPDGDVTLYGRLINTNPVVPDIIAENLRWEQEGKLVENRTIKAAWDAAEGAASYLVGLQLLVGSGDEVEKQDMSLTKEDFPEGVEVTDSGVAEVTGCELDFTETFKRFPEGGNYIFTVTPVMPEGSQGNIEMNESSVVTILRCIQKEEMGWNDSCMKAEWSAVEGADYYLVWIYAGGMPLSGYGDNIENYETLKPFLHDENSILIRSTEVDLSEIIGMYGSIAYRVLGYSDDKSQYYTPMYDVIISDSNA